MAYMASFCAYSPTEASSSSTCMPKSPLNSSTPIRSMKTGNKHRGSVRIGMVLQKKMSLVIASRVLAHAREISDEGGEEECILNNCNGGFSLVSEDSVFSSQGNTHSKQSVEKKIESTSNMKTPTLMPSHGSLTGGGTRAGLFRTPISGGVQNATSAHGLPRPALAVRNLMEQARFAHLCTMMSQMHHRRNGYPFGSLVDFVPDLMGHPIFSLSPLAIHTRNLLADPRCTLVVQIPGWNSLSNARVTIFGDVHPLPDDQQEWAHKQHIAKHQQGPSQQWGNFYYFRMQNISDIYFIGGFGTVAWVDVKEFEEIQPDKIAVNGGEQNLKELNAIFSKPLKELLAKEADVDDAALISIDSKGTDIRVRQGAQYNVQRISFEVGSSVETLEEAKKALSTLIDQGQLSQTTRNRSLRKRIGATAELEIHQKKILQNSRRLHNPCACTQMHDVQNGHKSQPSSPPTPSSHLAVSVGPGCHKYSFSSSPSPPFSRPPLSKKLFSPAAGPSTFSLDQRDIDEQDSKSCCLRDL
ncbi:unnamed protein product [Fraxinus pennsylvanica]|uniref:CREG-like beta-barrel domain-containing protein n=1 Tax=Fraxinus pennsylvanica TaxID=56036 RepID=A0AAD1ZCD4_9LAMI|nr:unnamed protein product [Fraxinus pennsylvanica]